MSYGLDDILSIVKISSSSSELPDHVLLVQSLLLLSKFPCTYFLMAENSSTKPPLKRPIVSPPANRPHSTSPTCNPPFLSSSTLPPFLPSSHSSPLFYSPPLLPRPHCTVHTVQKTSNFHKYSMRIANVVVEISRSGGGGENRG